MTLFFFFYFCAYFAYTLMKTKKNFLQRKEKDYERYFIERYS